MEAESSQPPTPAAKDPRTIARKYQMDLCKIAVEKNIIVYLGTGCGKTHIAVLLMYELGHLIRKPSDSVCVFLAPTVPLVRQQAVVIENCTDFKVKSYFGNLKNLKDHHEWNQEIEQVEVLVMTPQILLHNLRHRLIKMELIALLVFDECHHAQAQKRHPYAQIMKEFYKNDAPRSPRIFGMTASPIIGKGGSIQLNYTKCINSLENLLNAKIYSIEDNLELESVVASPNMKVCYYDPVEHSESSVILIYRRKLDQIKQQCMSTIQDKISTIQDKILDLKDNQKLLKLVLKMHERVVFCLENLGLYGAIQAVRILLTSDDSDFSEMKKDVEDSSNSLTDQYLNSASSVLCCNILDDNADSDSFALEILEEPFFSKKLSALIGILSRFRLKENTNCIIFVKRIIVARTLTNILRNLKALDFWNCEFLVGFHSGVRGMSRSKVNTIVEKFRAGEVNLLVATNVAEEGLDIQTCCLVVRFDLPETVASFIQSRGRARMKKSEYVFLVQRGNLHDEKLLNDFMVGEDIMNNEVTSRTSRETFDNLEETIYKVDSTGASISTGCSISLLYRYCDKLPRDIYFDPSPKFFFIDDLHGTICRIILPPNAPFRQVDSLPCSSKDEAKRAACLKACMELHKKGALTNYLLPGLDDENNKELAAHCSNSGNNHLNSANDDDECLREELHEMLVPAALKVAWSTADDVEMYFYYIKCVPIPDDRNYREFGLFVKCPLPNEAETMEVDLHLARGRIAKAGFVPSGRMTIDREGILLAQNFQEMFLKVILDRSEFFRDYVPLGETSTFNHHPTSTFYLLLPVKQKKCEESMIIDWVTVRRCLSSPVFRHPTVSCARDLYPTSNGLKLLNGTFTEIDIVNSLVFTPHNKLFYFIDGILHETNACSQYKTARSYGEHYMSRFGIQLSYPEQPLLKAKLVFSLHNLLHNRVQESKEARELVEHFVELPPEMCTLKIFGFSKDIGSTLSLLPSLMHRLENLLVAIELKDLLSASFPEGSKIRADCILEALTTEKCLERLSLERFEVLGDSFLKYIVGRHSFLSYQGLDEGQLTKKRSSIVNNSNLYELAIKKNLQVYVRDELFQPLNFFALGRPCTVVCNVDTELIIHNQQGNDTTVDGIEASSVKCTRSHRWIHRKTIADVVEALVGAFLVQSGFMAANAFLRWIGVEVDFAVPDVYRVLEESRSNLSLTRNIDIDALERLLGYRFNYRGLLLEAFVHPSYNKHSGGCYQKLEFLGDAVLEYLITTYVYSVYPDLKPGQITDLRSIIANNNSFAHIAVWRSFHEYLIEESNSLNQAVKKFKNFALLSVAERDLVEEPACPKVLGDIVESSIGAILLDTGFDLNVVWSTMLNLLEPVLKLSNFQINPIRELRELCQSYNFELGLPSPVKQNEVFSVQIEIDAKGKHLSYTAINNSSKAARKTAAQEALCQLKELGFNHKCKSLEEIVKSARKNAPQLIGFDEDPVMVDNLSGVSTPLEKLRIHEAEEASSSSSNNIFYETSSIPSNSPQRSKAEKHGTRTGNEKHEPVVWHQKGQDELIENGHHLEMNGIKSYKSARSQLFELCAGNYWSPPSFECCKEEGPPHLRMFTYKVTIEVEGPISALLECYSDPKSQKKAAQEHAAEGAMWYLMQIGFTPKA